MNIIVAVGRNYGIGLNNDLIYSIPEDKKYFRSMTLGKVIVMGRKTLESMPNGKPLPKRRNVVLSRNPEYSAEDVEICNTAYTTLVESEKQADKVFPEIDKMPEWKLVSQSEEQEADGVKFCFCKYTR